VTTDAEKAADRLHIVEGLLTALDDLTRVNDVVGGCTDRAAAKAALSAAFGLSDIQVNCVLDMTVARQTQLGRSELRREAELLRSQLSSG
jgi:DNA gyrase subunit A